MSMNSPDTLRLHTFFEQILLVNEFRLQNNLRQLFHQNLKNKLGLTSVLKVPVPFKIYFCYIYDNLS